MLGAYATGIGLEELEFVKQGGFFHLYFEYSAPDINISAIVLLLDHVLPATD